MGKILRIEKLTSTQEGMLFHSLYHKTGTHYHQQFCFYLEGGLDIKVLGEAWQATVDRHESCRTDILWKKVKQIVQVVVDQKEAEFSVVDLTARPETRKADIEKIKAADLKQGFDFEQGRLNRMKVLKLSPTRLFVCWSFHHILFDGWSVGLLLKDWLTFYQASFPGTAAPPRPAASSTTTSAG